MQDDSLLYGPRPDDPGDGRERPVRSARSARSADGKARERRIRRKAFRRRSRRRRNLVVFSAFSSILLVFFLFTVFSGQRDPERAETPATGSQLTPPNVSGDLQAELRDFAEVYPGEYGVAVSDPDTGESASVNADRSFDAASLAKLPVLMTLYRDAASGEVDLDEKMTMKASDMQTYGTGVLRDYPVGYEISLHDCAKLLMKRSDNTAWVMLERRLGKDRIASELEVLGAGDTDYATYTTTPSDVLLMLQAISDPRYTSPDLSKEMLFFMTDTAYEDRLPAPLPPSVRVAHKVGTWKDTFSDAGIVYRTDDEGDTYFIVVVSSGVGEKRAREAIHTTSKITYESL